MPPIPVPTRRKQALAMRDAYKQLYETVINDAGTHLENDDKTGEFSFSKGLKDHVATTGLPSATTYPDFVSMLDNVRTWFDGTPGGPQWNPTVPGTPSDPREYVDGVLSGITGPRKMVNPLAGVAFDAQGADMQDFTMPVPYETRTKEALWELAELYWMALSRDIHFNDYAIDPLIAEAAKSLDGAPGKPVGDLPAGGTVTPATLFRGITKGDLEGPYLSQFLMKPIRFGTLRTDQIQYTAAAGKDYLTDWKDWLAVQDGADIDNGRNRLPDRRYIRNLRDLATYVHFDGLFEAYINACLILQDMGIPAAPGNPYLDSSQQAGFGTFGDPYIQSLVCEVATRALRSVWFQKWYIHRRMRPEEAGGRAEATRNGALPNWMDLTGALQQPTDRVLAKNGNILLPMAFPEGSPTHPAYGAGHATVAGACVTILKAFFDNDALIKCPVTVSAGGDELNCHDGALTVEGELNKLCANISIGRNGAGVHWRSDYTQSIILGEKIAMALLLEQSINYAELGASYTIRRFFGGPPVTITSGTIAPNPFP